jgi:hypothetical protein
MYDELGFKIDYLGTNINGEANKKGKHEGEVALKVSSMRKKMRRTRKKNDARTKFELTS